MHLAVRLANRPDHPKIADGSSRRALISLKQNDALPPAGGRESVGKPQYSSPYDCNIRTTFHIWQKNVGAPSCCSADQQSALSNRQFQRSFAFSDIANAKGCSTLATADG
jgi:hypothetical protein